MTTGTRLKALRGNRRQNEVAKEIGISYASLSRFETDKRLPTAHNLIKLADYYGVTTDYILGREVQVTMDDVVRRLEAIEDILEVEECLK